MIYLGQAVKKPIPVKVYTFDGTIVLTTQEGQTSNVDSKKHLILEDKDGNQWPVDKKYYEANYNFIDKG